MATLIAARLSSSAFDQFARGTNAPDLYFDVGEEQPVGDVLALPGVESVGRATSIAPPAFWQDGGRVRRFPPDVALLAVDSSGADELDGVAIRSGRAARPAADEAVANRAWLDAVDLEVGDTLGLRLVDGTTMDELSDLTGPAVLAALDADPNLGRAFDLTIVGEFASSADIARDEASRPARLLIPDDVVVREWPVPPELLWCCGLELFVGLAEDADTARVEAALAALPGEGNVVARLSEQRRRVQTATEPFVLALTTFAVLAGVAGVIVAGGAVARQAVHDARQDVAHRVSGADRRLLIRFALTRAAVIGAVAVAIAVAIVAIVSPHLLLGPAAPLVSGPSVRTDVGVLGLGAALVVVGFLAVSVAAVWAAGRPAASRRSSPPWTLSWSVPLVTALGLHLAFPRTGRTRFLLRSALLTTAVALGMATAVAVVSGSLRDLIRHPERHGSGWDAAITCNEGYCEINEVAVANFRALLADRADVMSWSFVTFGSVDLDGQATPAVGADRDRDGPSPFAVSSGRTPEGADEVVLGPTTMRRLGAAIGDELDVGGGGSTLRVVGAAAFSGLGQADAERASLGVGAGFTRAGLREHGDLDAGANAVLVAGDQVPPYELATALRDVTDMTVISRNAPGPLAAWNELRLMPFALTGLLAVLGIGTLTHAVALSARARRRDVALWRALGLRLRDARSALVWQGAFLTGASLAIGVPLGLVAGISAWSRLRGTLGLSTPTLVWVPQLTFVLAIAIASVGALAVALHARSSGTVADVLRAE